MTTQPARTTNGDVPTASTEKTTPSTSAPPRVVLSGKTGRILCVADIRGDYHELNRLIKEHEATAVIHTGDFGFMNEDSVDRMGDRILRHLITYSPLISSGTRTQLLSIPSAKDTEPDRKALIDQLNNSSVHFPLSQFPHLLSGAINFPVPVFTVWGLIEDVRVLEKFRTGEYEVNNLHIIDEATSKVVDVGGLRLRLFGLGGAVTPHKMCEGYATIAGGSGTMWATALQMGELIDTAHRVYDASETRLFISSAPSRNGLISLIANALKADLTISGGLHFRYPVSFNEFSVHERYDHYQQKLASASNHFQEVYDAVRDRVDSSMNEQQQALLKKISSAVTNIPKETDQTWTNTWNWILSDASCGHMVLSVTDSRVSAETKTSGLNFAHRTGQGLSLPSAPVTASTAGTIAGTTRAPDAPKTIAPTRAPIGPGSAPSKPGQPSAAPPTGPNSFKNGLNRNNSSRPLAPNATTASPAPVSQSSAPATNNASSSIPVKPPTQPRGGARGTGSATAAGSAFQAVTTVKDKIVDAVKPNSAPTKPPPAGSAKSSATTASTKPTAATLGAKEETKKSSPATNGASANGNGNNSSEVANTSTESKEGTNAKPAHGREGSGEARPKKPSLYLKGLPIPTTEEEIKGLFKDQADKIVQVKIIQDKFTNKQKDFGYVDFDTDEEMNAALKSAEGAKIKESAITISVSNPPSRFSESTFRGRGRGGPSFRGSRGRGFGSIGGGLGRKDSEDAKESKGAVEKKE
ncbi:uncharacterized protein I206_101146 [Kwoniella pini CBS 10737]|uniref:RRM domain-containing protein n=1 Tax=Kwoniella pini CBS 10737 TaxID=1296096 RepID=A0A1B9IBC6_9TREE|nr:uncharacterized protein I206_00180 [Kwoniella pini CBS 10737]OCF52879.1 hypothetical protein I206_00180 [Kwoniella pini CBS 10737]